MPEGLNTHEMRSALKALFVDVVLVGASAGQDMVMDWNKNSK